MKGSIASAIIDNAQTIIALTFSLVSTFVTLMFNQRTQVSRQRHESETKAEGQLWEHREKLWAMAADTYSKIAAIAADPAIQDCKDKLSKMEPHILTLCLVCNATSEAAYTCRKFFDLKEEPDERFSNNEVLMNTVVKLGSELFHEFSKPISPQISRPEEARKKRKRMRHGKRR